MEKSAESQKRERQGHWIFNRIIESRYKRRYKEIMKNGRPEDLSTKRKRGVRSWWRGLGVTT